MGVLCIKTTVREIKNSKGRFNSRLVRAKERSTNEKIGQCPE